MQDFRNIKEGCGAATNKEFARFLDVSIKSANETGGHLPKARDLNLFSPDEWRGYAMRARDHGAGGPLRTQN